MLNIWTQIVGKLKSVLSFEHTNTQNINILFVCLVSNENITF